MADTEQTNLTILTVDLLSAYVANNSVPSADLAELVRATHTALKAIDAPAPEQEAAPVYQAAVSARKSLSSPDYILSMIDGKPYKTLKRHLAGHGLTPAEYRERYKLPNDYPLVAPAYSEQRRIVAKKLGLGRKRTAPPAASQGSSAKAATGAAAASKGATVGARPRKVAQKTPATKAGDTGAAKAKAASKATKPDGRRRSTPKS